MMQMNNLKKSQVLTLFILSTLVSITPLLSSSLRPTYLYFLMNLLIVAVGAEAGILFKKPTSQSHDHYHNQDKIIIKHAPNPIETLPPPIVVTTPPCSNLLGINTERKSPFKVVEKFASVKITTVINKKVVKKCPSTPSIFFIGGGCDQWTDDESVAGERTIYDDDMKMEEEIIEEEGISGQELFTKAEMFIGNFYKQLKMQREESWKKIHGFYHKAF